MQLELFGEVQCGAIENADTMTLILSEDHEGIESNLNLKMSKAAAYEVYECLCCTFEKEDAESKKKDIDSALTEFEKPVRTTLCSIATSNPNEVSKQLIMDVYPVSQTIIFKVYSNGIYLATFAHFERALKEYNSL